MFEALEYPFAQRALIAALAIGITSGIYGAFAVQKKMSFLGAGLSHAAFGGVALGLLLGIEPLTIALPFTIAVGIVIAYLKENSNLNVDAAIGVMFSSSVALGVVFLSMKDSYTADAYAYLFGSILSIGELDVWVGAITAIIAVTFAVFFWGAMAYEAFDRELAESDGVNAKRLNYALIFLISLSVAISIKLVGIALIAAFLVIPAAAAKMFSKTFFALTLSSVAIGAVSSVVGLFLSYDLDIPSGATIILTQTAIFLLSFAASKVFRLSV